MPWFVAAGAVLVIMAGILVMLARQAPATPPLAAAGAASESAPPDISSMTPRERFDRLYNRVMTASQAGDEATVTQFTPMALQAYAMLDSVDPDARYHLALLQVHGGQVDAAGLQADSIAGQVPHHLFGPILRGTVARWKKDDRALKRAYADFLAWYEEEMKVAREEYEAHKTSLDEFRSAAQAAR